MSMRNPRDGPEQVFTTLREAPAMLDAGQVLPAAPRGERGACGLR